MGALDLPRCFNFTGNSAETSMLVQLVHLLLNVCEKSALRVRREWADCRVNVMREGLSFLPFYQEAAQGSIHDSVQLHQGSEAVQPP